MKNPLVAHHRVALAGHVTDAVTQKAIAGAVVTIVAMPDEFKQRLRRTADSGRTLSRSDGLYYFLDLPDGDYTLQVSLPASGKRYGTAQQTARVPVEPKPGGTFRFVNLALQPTTVQGKITSRGQRNGVMLARVQIKGSGERTLSDDNGEYTLSGIEPGKRELLVRAQGYRTAAEPVTIGEAGTSQIVNVTLTREG